MLLSPERFARSGLSAVKLAAATPEEIAEAARVEGLKSKSGMSAVKLAAATTAELAEAARVEGVKNGTSKPHT